MTALDPRFAAPIPTSTNIPNRFTPPSFDPMGVYEKRKRELEAHIKDLDGEIERVRDEAAMIAPEQAAESAGKIAAIIERKSTAYAAIGKAREAAEAKAALPEFRPVPSFLIRYPSSFDRENLNSRLLDLGITTVTKEQVRASIIESLFEIDWSKEGAPGATSPDFKSDDYAEEMAQFLDGIWQREEIQLSAFNEWRKQESERLLDIMHGAPAVPALPTPPRVISVRDESRATLLLDRVSQTPRMRVITKRQLEFSSRNAVLLIRMHVRGVAGIEGLELIPEPRQDALPDEQVTALREAIDTRYGSRVATNAWNELVEHIDQLYRLDEFEEGNSASPLVKPSDQTGSEEASGDTGTNGGASTASDTTAAPAAESETIIEPLPASASECRETTGSDSLTEGAS
jgi:hypothetical protein